MRGGESVFDVGPPDPPPARLNLAAHALWAGQPAGRTALTVVGPDAEARDVWTYAALRDAVARTAGGLRAAGLRRGEPVMLRLGNRSDFPIVFLAVAAAGGVAAPTSAMLTAPEARTILDDLGARFVVADPDLAFDHGAATPLDPAALRRADPAPLADTAADDPAYVVFTSGSSGRPKGVLHAHRAVWARRMMWRDWFGLTAADRMLHAGAFNWTYTLGAGLLDPWGAGAETVIYDGPRDPGVWARVAARHEPTLFAATPGVYRQLLKYGENVGPSFASLRAGLSAGEPLAPSLADAWIAETGRPVWEALGMTEVSTYVSSGPETPPRAGFAGKPQRGRRVAVLDPGTGAPAPVGARGLLAVARRDPGLMLGYWRDPAGSEAAFRGDWFVTGDVAEMDADGYVGWRGRADAVMNAGGYRVAPEEIEAALAAHPGVLDAAAREKRLAADLSIIEAVVVAPGVDQAALEAWCAGRLAAYKRPKAWRFVDSLPRTPTGKLRRKALGA